MGYIKITHEFSMYTLPINNLRNLEISMLGVYLIVITLFIFAFIN